MLRVNGVFSGSNGAPMYNALYFGGLTSGEAGAAATAARSFWNHMANALNGQMAYTTGSEVDVVDPVTGQITSTFSITPQTVDFTGTGEVLPQATQGLVRLRTNTFINGRRVRGRIFIPGVTELMSTAGTPISGTQTLFQDAANLLITNGAGAGGLVVYSPTHGQSAPVVSASPWDQFAVQRSRRQ